MSDERMPPQEAHVEAFLESLVDVAVPGDLAGAVSASVRERPSRRPSLRLPVLTAAAGLLLTVSVAMAAGWRPPFDILPGPQGTVTLPPVASADASPPASTAPADTWEWATLMAQTVETVVDPVTRESAGWNPASEIRFDSVLVLGRRVVDGRTWVRIEQGGWDSEARFVWIPETVPSVGPSGYDVATLEHTTWIPCDTSGPPTIGPLGSLTAAQRLACYGGATFTLGPVKVVPAWDDTANTGTPGWLAGPITTTLQGPIESSGGIPTVPVRVKPGSGMALLPGTWVTVTAHFDDPAAASCVRQTSDVSGAPVGEPSDQVLWCRQQLVIETATEVPEPTAAPPTPAPYPTFLGATSPLPAAPLDGRLGETATWTGRELVIWGGAHRGQVGGSDDLPADGAALDVAAGTWRAMAASPLAGRSEALGAWTGTEMLAWGGSSTADATWLADGAAWNAATNTWRRLPTSPLKGSFPQVGAWAGDRWYVASGKGLAAYDPGTSTWTSEADLPIGADDLVRMAWTGDRLALFTQTLAGAQLWTLFPGQAWVHGDPPPLVDVPADGMVFGGGRLWTIGAVPEGSASGQPAGSQVIAWWDPASGTWQIVDSPVETRAAAAVWNGTHLVIVGEYGAAYDPGARDWLMLPGGGTERLREEPSVVWAGDRLLVWGGGQGEVVNNRPDGWQLPWDIAGG